MNCNREVQAQECADHGEVVDIHQSAAEVGRWRHAHLLISPTSPLPASVTPTLLPTPGTAHTSLYECLSTTQ